MNDEQFRVLLERNSNGDRAAAEELAREVDRVLRTLAKAHRKNFVGVDESEDVVQSTHRAALVALEREGPDVQHPRAFLEEIMRRTIRAKLDRARAGKRGRDHRRTTPTSVAGTATSPSEGARRLEETVFVEAALKLLPVDDQRIVRLHADGVSWAEIGEAIGKSPDAVRMRYARIIERLRRIHGAP